jgi:hypothetical protein
MQARLSVAVQETLSELSTSTTSLPHALNKGIEAYRKELTTVICLTGAAMLPNLNGRATATPDAVESLLLRWLPRPSSKNVFVGDVVAFNSPLATADIQNVLIRRVAAMEGEEMVSDDPEDEPFFIPPGVCPSSSLSPLLLLGERGEAGPIVLPCRHPSFWGALCLTSIAAEGVAGGERRLVQRCGRGFAY